MTAPERRGADERAPRPSGGERAATPAWAGSPWGAWLAGQRAEVRAAGRWRELRALDAAGPTGTLAAAAGEPGGARPVVSFAGNDYLGLTQHPAVKAAAVEAVERWGTGAGASRLVVGTRPVHEALEADLADWRGAEAALAFPTGYAANTGVLGALGGPGVVVCSDALNHASIVDGCRLAAGRGAEVRVYRHLDLDHLAALLAEASAAGRRAVVATDTVFSMDGDVAPLAELGALAGEHGALVVADDAHAVLDVPALPEGVAALRVGTLSKALGAQGGFVAGPRGAVELLVNRARPFIFTTALAPADAAAARAALAVSRSADGDALRARLAGHVAVVRPGHPTPIVPVVVGSEEAALAAAAALLDRGLLVPAIRPPTVPPGTSRLRVALSAAHTDDQVAALRAALADLDDPDDPATANLRSSGAPSGPAATQVRRSEGARR